MWCLDTTKIGIIFFVLARKAGNQKIIKEHIYAWPPQASQRRPQRPPRPCPTRRPCTTRRPCPIHRPRQPRPNPASRLQPRRRVLTVFRQKLCTVIYVRKGECVKSKECQCSGWNGVAKMRVFNVFQWQSCDFWYRRVQHSRIQGSVSAATTLKACLAVCGIPADATSRELHVLFSGCPGHLDFTCSDY